MQQKYNRNPNNIKELTVTRKALRNEGTSAEAVLWLSLKGRQVEGMRWRRQFGVGPYILDFYCPQLRLCIELDGASHYTLEGSENDAQREVQLLQEYGIRTIRFENKDIFCNSEGVMEHIRGIIKEVLNTR